MFSLRRSVPLLARHVTTQARCISTLNDTSVNSFLASVPPDHAFSLYPFARSMSTGGNRRGGRGNDDDEDEGPPETFGGTPPPTEIDDNDTEYWDTIHEMFEDVDVAKAIMNKDVPMKNQEKRLEFMRDRVENFEPDTPDDVMEVVTKRKLCCYILGSRHTNKVVKGGNLHSVSSLVVVGNGMGSAGYGVGKARTMEKAVSNATALAMRDMVSVELFGGNTLYHDLRAHVNGSIIEIRSRDLGNRRRCSPMMYLLLEAFGIRNCVVKCHGNKNRFSMVQAFFKALRVHYTSDEVAMKRGLRLFHHAHHHSKVNYRH